MFSPEEVLFNTLGFSITRDRSSLVSAGTGVFVTKGFVPKGTVVSMYPGNEMFFFFFFCFLIQLDGISNPVIIEYRSFTLIFISRVYFCHSFTKSQVRLNGNISV